MLTVLLTAARPCPFYSQGRCLFADSCNFMHSVKIRRPDSVVGSEDSDQPDYRIVVDSPTSGRTVRFKSPPRSPRTMSLLMALGDAIQPDEDEGEWEEEESGEQESCSGEGSSDGRPSSEYTEPPPVAPATRPESVGPASPLLRNEDAEQGPMLIPAGDAEDVGRPTPILGLNEDARQILTEVPSPEDDTREFVESSLWTNDTTLFDSFSPRSSSPTGDASMVDDEETITRFRNNIIPEFPLPPTRVPSPRRDSTSTSSGLLSPIEITPAPPISLPRHAPVSREESFDSGYADGPGPMCLSPPRSPHRMSTFSILSSPFGSPSARVLRFDNAAAPAAALFSPRFGSFPSLDQRPQVDRQSGSNAGHIRSDSVDTLDATQEETEPVEARAVASTTNAVHVEVTEAVIEDPSSPSPPHTRHSSIPEGSSLFRAVHSPVYPPIDESSLRPGEPSFAEDDTMSSLYDQYYTPTTHSIQLLPPAAQEASPATLVGSVPPRVEPIPEAGPSSPPSRSSPSSSRPQSLARRSPAPASLHHASPSQPSSSRPASLRHTPSVKSSSPSRSISHEEPRLEAPSSRDSDHPRVFSPPSSSGSAIGNVMLGQLRSPAVSVTNQVASPSASVENAPAPAEGSVRSSSSMSSRTEDSQGQLVSRKVPFGFRNSMSERSQASARGSRASLSVRIPTRPPPLVDVGKEVEKAQTSAASFSSNEPPSATSSAGPGRLKPLRLSMILGSSTSLGSSVPSATHPPSLTTATTATTAYTPNSPTVSSEYSLSNNRLLSSPRSSIIPPRARNTHGSSSQPDSPLHITPVFSQSQPASAPVSRPPSWQQRFSKRRSLLVQSSRRLSYLSEQYARSESRLSEPIDESREDEYDEEADQADETIRRPVSSQSATQPQRESVLLTPVHAIATPRPTLLFALASDDVEEVRRVLESGEARPNDDVGPQSALAFTLANGQLKNKMAMVKLLLAYGADASALREAEDEDDGESSSKRGSRPISKLLEEADPATRYYIERANSPQTRRASALIHRSFFRPLTRVRYDLIGQDRVLEQLFRVLSMPTMAPIVVLLCGPSGHGKSLLARKFGSLLDVPTHTVNMTTLQNTRDIWKSHSIDPHEEPSDRSLKDFLMDNEGKRCVVVLDEIEKAQDEKILSSLLMPWEYGRCSFEAGHRHVDVSKVIWLGTSNIGHDLVFEHQDHRPAPETQLSREEYIDLMALLRPRVSERLGASLLSRVTAVLPFVAFTADEKMAIAAEALFALAGEAVTTMPPATRDLIVRTSLNSYIPSEGARSLYRAVSTQLLDTI
ncbi:hypothetical protein ONZ51_g6434 [Trametes cubensis]|uniref:C3H1-type domain-containing protein n=1 Tax=Trametes cubensis TaxID=1111947 RepID=A0AAD7TSJ3_9APHY|nr:hypothetical protein ONZ51_g6434 [Trametes cubensis]